MLKPSDKTHTHIYIYTYIISIHSLDLRTEVYASTLKAYRLIDPYVSYRVLVRSRSWNGVSAP